MKVKEEKKVTGKVVTQRKKRKDANGATTEIYQNNNNQCETERNKEYIKQAENNMTGAKTYISIIALNINRLCAPIKRYRIAGWIIKPDPTICCLQETHFTSKDTYRLKVKEWKKICHANSNCKEAEVVVLTSDKINFQFLKMLLLEVKI